MVNSMEESRPIRVLVLDESPSIADGLGLLINSSRGLTSISQTHADNDIATTLERLRPDVVVVSPEFLSRRTMMSPGQLASSLRNTRFIAFCPQRQMTSMTDLADQGYAGAISKFSPTQKLLRAVTVVGMGGHFFDVNEAECGVSPARAAAEGVESISMTGLTLREETVLRRVAMGRAIKEIAAEVKLSQKTIETYKARAVRKLKLNNRSEIVQYAIYRGWLSS